MALIALGYRDLSMSATAIGPVKAMVLSLDVGDGARARSQALLADGGDAGSACASRCEALAERLARRGCSDRARPRPRSAPTHASVLPNRRP